MKKQSIFICLDADIIGCEEAKSQYFVGTVLFETGMLRFERFTVEIV